MIAAAWLMLSSLIYTLQLSTGSFPKPLTAQEERHYLALSVQGDLDARNVLIERNLRLVAHIMKKYYPFSRFIHRGLSSHFAFISPVHRAASAAPFSRFEIHSSG